MGLGHARSNSHPYGLIRIQSEPKKFKPIPKNPDWIRVRIVGPGQFYQPQGFFVVVVVVEVFLLKRKKKREWVDHGWNKRRGERAVAKVKRYWSNSEVLSLLRQPPKFSTTRMNWWLKISRIADWEAELASPSFRPLEFFFVKISLPFCCRETEPASDGRSLRTGGRGLHAGEKLNKMIQSLLL